MITRVFRFLMLLLLFSVNSKAFAQELSLRQHVLLRGDTLLKLDSLTLYPNSLEVRCGKERLNAGNYEIRDRKWLVIKVPCGDSLLVTYRVLPMDLDARLQRRDTNLIYSSIK